MEKLIMLATTVNKGDSMDVGTGALYSIVAILMVFLILLVIIGITTLVFKALGLFQMKAELDKANKTQKSETVESAAVSKSTTIVDDDMMAAVLVATIDYRNEVKKDVKLVSVREVK